MIKSITLINGPSRINSATEANYLKQFNAMRNFSSIRRRFGLGPQDDASIEQIIDDFIRREDLRHSTRRTYCSAGIWILENTMAPCELRGHLLEKLRNMVIVKPGRNTKRAPRAISEADFERILNQLSKCRKDAKWAPATALWLRAGLATGARPCEWQFAKWHNHERNILVIINSKVKQRVPTFKPPKSDTTASSRDFADKSDEYFDPHWRVWPEVEIPQAERYIDFLTPDEIESIQAHMESIERHLSGILNIAERQLAFDEYHEQCSCALKRACKKIWSGKRCYCLYTFRGQFAANMKAYFGSEATAVLMGHSSAHSSSTSYYGLGSQAHARYKGHRQSEFQIPAQRNRYRRCECE